MKEKISIAAPYLYFLTIVYSIFFIFYMTDVNAKYKALERKIDLNLDWQKKILDRWNHEDAMKDLDKFNEYRAYVNERN